MPIPLRSDYDADQVRAAARRTKDGPQARRLLALAAIYDGGTRTEAARIGGVTLQIVRGLGHQVQRRRACGPCSTELLPVSWTPRLGCFTRLEGANGTATVQPGVQSGGGPAGEECGVSVVQASRDLDVGENILRRWIKELTSGFRAFCAPAFWVGPVIREGQCSD